MAVEGTVAGRAYQLGEILPANSDGGGPVLWVPMLDGADRAGVLRIGLGPGVVDEEPLRRRCWAVSGLLGHILIRKVPYSERLRWMRSGGSLSASAELMWQLVPPRTFATDRLVVTSRRPRAARMGRRWSSSRPPRLSVRQGPGLLLSASSRRVDAVRG